MNILNIKYIVIQCKMSTFIYFTNSLEIKQQVC